MNSWIRLFPAVLFLASTGPSHASVVRLEIAERRDLPGTGYEEVVGRLFFEVDPAHSRNTVVADLDLAPTNAAGRVEFSSDLRLLKPKEDSAANGAAWIEIPNRGGKAKLEDWQVKHGFTLVNVGWEFDVPTEQDKLRIEVPHARKKDGTPIRGVVAATFTPQKRIDAHPLTDLEAYPAVDIDGPESRLVVRTRSAFPGGDEIPRALWSLEGNQIRMEGGFEPGKTYEVTYLAENPPVAGLGYAAIRDAVSWLRHGDDSPIRVDHAYAFGSSQCGRFLRDFLYLGFNADEGDRPVLDGVIAHVAGAGRLVLNERWSTPRAVAGYHTVSYPFADPALPDPVSGWNEGILENRRKAPVPRIFYVNMAAEYWGAGRAAALTHTDPSGTRDLELPENVRSYFYAGTSHGPSGFPPTRLAERSPLANPVNTSASVRALRIALHRWIAEGVAPPPSVHPSFADGTLTHVAEIRFPEVPGMGDPRGITAGPRVRNPRWPDGAGAGSELPLLVPQVDQDGNDLGGIRMPELAVPLGTATGWVFRPETMGSPHEIVLLRGAWIPFARTEAERAQSMDPRPSLETRYDSKDAYLAMVRTAAESLVEAGLLDESDFEPQVRLAGERWDWVMRGAE